MDAGGRAPAPGVPIPATVVEAAAALRAGRLTSERLVGAVLDRADRIDGALGAYLARFDESALADARRADEELARGRDRGPLHGIPMGVKDLLALVRGRRRRSAPASWEGGPRVRGSMPERWPGSEPPVR